MTHGETKNGKVSREYRAWQNAKNRCHNPNAQDWARYGGRGITMCERWRNSFAAFLDDMGRSNGLTLDRIDVNGNYEPGNCRWATYAEQNRNRRDTKLDDCVVMQIRWLCTDGGFTQTEVAKAFDLYQGNVSNILSGRAWK